MQRSVEKRLAFLANAKRIVTIVRDLPGEPYEYGFVLGVGHLVLLNQFHDFYSEGLAAIRLDEIASVRCGKSERFFTDIILKEGLKQDYPNACEIDLSSAHLFIKSLRSQYDSVILECESRVWAAEDEFYLGRVLKVDEGRTVLRCIDSSGTWDPEPITVDHQDLTKIQFDTPYINLISRHMKGAGS